MYMQYFLGYSSFTAGVPFDASLFVDLRERIGQDLLNAINERIVTLHRQAVERQAGEGDDDISDDGGLAQPGNGHGPEVVEPVPQPADPTPRGRVLFDATVCPQDIAYPTDLGLLNESREKTEGLIDAIP